MEATRAYRERGPSELAAQPTWDGNDDVCSVCCLGVRRDGAACCLHLQSRHVNACKSTSQRRCSVFACCQWPDQLSTSDHPMMTLGCVPAQGEDLLCCETCPAIFHLECLGLSAMPDEDHWHCNACVCAACGQPGFGELQHARCPVRRASSADATQCCIKYGNAQPSKPLI